MSSQTKQTTDDELYNHFASIYDYGVDFSSGLGNIVIAQFPRFPGEASAFEVTTENTQLRKASVWRRLSLAAKVLSGRYSVATTLKLRMKETEIPGQR